MPPRDKLIIAITVLLLPASPFIAFIIMAVGMSVYFQFVVATWDGPGPLDCEVGEPWFLPLIGFGPVVIAQIGMVIASTRAIREHRRRRKAGRMQ